jgi:RNA polymerase sigma-70 factor (ECF subfamily)
MQSDVRIDLEKALCRLSAPERAVLTLCHAMQFSQEEAAEILKMPLGTVKSHATRGRGKLQVLLREWNGEP